MNKLNDKNMTNESLRLREIIREIGLPLRRLPDVIEMKRADCLAWWSNNKFEIKLDSKPFSRLTEIVAIDENCLFTGNYDKALARKRVMGDFRSLPDRYTENQNSFLRTSAHIIRYIILTRGQHFADQILYSLNVSPLIYQQSYEQSINLTYFADLLDTLSRRGFSQEELDTLASVIFLSLKETELGKVFEKSESSYDVYSILAKNFDYFDTNFEYKSRFLGTKYHLKTTLDLTKHMALKENSESIHRLLRYRKILLAWFPYLAGLTPLFAKSELTFFSNKVEMSYEVDLSSGSKQSLNFRVV